MPLFTTDAERQRKEGLKRMEDERLRFAEDLERRNFQPERMLFCSREDGSFVAVARHEDKLALIESPRFGQEGEFALSLLAAPEWEREEVFEKGTGLNGAFGFGTKGARGFNLFVRNEDGLFVKMPVVCGRNSWLEVPFRKNPLLKRKRRRGDSNVMWDFAPIDNRSLVEIEEKLTDYYLRASAASGEAQRPSEADAFYGALKERIEAEGLQGDDRICFGRIANEPRCLSVARRGEDDCAVSYRDERGVAVFDRTQLTQEQAEELCLSFLRDQKQRRELYQKWSSNGPAEP